MISAQQATLLAAKTIGRVDEKVITQTIDDIVNQLKQACTKPKGSLIISIKCDQAERSHVMEFICNLLRKRGFQVSHIAHNFKHVSVNWSVYSEAKYRDTNEHVPELNRDNITAKLVSQTQIKYMRNNDDIVHKELIQEMDKAIRQAIKNQQSQCELFVPTFRHGFVIDQKYVLDILTVSVLERGFEVVRKNMVNCSLVIAWPAPICDKTIQSPIEGEEIQPTKTEEDKSPIFDNISAEEVMDYHNECHTRVVTSMVYLRLINSIHPPTTQLTFEELEETVQKYKHKQAMCEQWILKKLKAG